MDSKQIKFTYRNAPLLGAAIISDGLLSKLVVGHFSFGDGI